MSSNKKDPLRWEDDSHAALRATTIDRAIQRFEDIVSHKGVSIKVNENEILDSLQQDNGIITSDEDVYNLAKLYCIHGRMKQARDRCPVIDISVTPYFSFEETAHALTTQLLGRPLRPAEKPEELLFESIALKRRERGGKKPLLYVAMRWEGRPRKPSTDLTSLLDVMRSLLVTREARVILFSQKVEEVNPDLSKFLKLIKTGGYFS